jgi:uncharacterized protein
MRNQIRAFHAGVEEKLGAYVYTLHDPDLLIANIDGNDFKGISPFYIGVGGTGESVRHNRVFSHFDEADRTAVPAVEFASDKIRKIIQIWDSGKDVAVFVHRSGLTAKEAYEVEASLIQAFPNAHNKVEGHHTSTRGRDTLEEVNNQLAAKPIKFDFPAIVIHLRSSWPWIKQAQSDFSEFERRLYAATRTAWSVDSKVAANFRHVISVADDLVRQNYVLPEKEAWQPATRNNRGLEEIFKKKKMFTGKISPEYAHLIGTSVPKDWFGNGKQAARRYFKSWN